MAAPFLGGPHAQGSHSRRRQDRRAHLRPARRVRLVRSASRRRERRGCKCRGQRASASPNLHAHTLDASDARGARCAAQEASGRRRDLEPALLLQHRSRRSGAARRYTLFRSDRGRGGHARRAQDRRRRRAGVRAPVRPRARLHLHRRQRTDRPLRRAAHRQAARRRPAPASEQRPEVLADLVDRGPDQRVRQSVRGDRRRPAHRGRAARRAGGNRDRRHAVRSVQYLRRPRLARRNLRRARAEHGLQDHALSRPLRADAPADERPEAQSRSRHAQAHPRERRAADAAGRRRHLRRRHRQAGRRTARGELRQQGVSADDRRPPVVGDPGDDRGGHLRRRRSRA